MSSWNYIDDVVIIDNKLKNFLKFKQDSIKMNVLLNFILCNYFDECNMKFYIKDNFRNFLEKNNKYYGDDYSIEGVDVLLKNFILKNKIEIRI
jgi:hypothetical protein